MFLASDKNTFFNVFYSQIDMFLQLWPRVYCWGKNRNEFLLSRCDTSEGLASIPQKQKQRYKRRSKTDFW